MDEARADHDRDQTRPRSHESFECTRCVQTIASQFHGPGPEGPGPRGPRPSSPLIFSLRDYTNLIYMVCAATPQSGLFRASYLATMAAVATSNFDGSFSVVSDNSETDCLDLSTPCPCTITLMGVNSPTELNEPSRPRWVTWVGRVLDAFARDASAYTRCVCDSWSQGIVLTAQ